jgi:3-(3-hydroxy-phenyl)propionate hydroxylase
MQQANGRKRMAPVAIVGGGPVGLCTALHFSRLQVPFVLFEEDEGLSTAPKAGTVTPRTLEIFALVGVIDDILAAGLRFDVVDFVERRKDEVLMQMLMDELDRDTSYPFVLNLPQSDTEHILYEHLERANPGAVRFNHKVMALEQDEDGCRLTLERPDGTETVEASYVVACDGGKSPIRKILGIEHKGKTYPEKFALIDIEADLDSGEDRRPTYLSYVFDPDEWLIIVRQPKLWRVLWPIAADAPEPAAQDEEVHRKLRLAVGDRPIKILSAISYKVHHRVAQKWRSGRTFLAGDAAHLITPIGGLGLNTGIQDANNLPWKISWVMTGRADPELLDTYEKERRPIAEFIASGLADRNRTMMQMKNPLKRTARDMVLKIMRHSRAHRWNTAYTRSLLSTSYKVRDAVQGSVKRALNALRPEIHPLVTTGDRAPDGLLFGPDGRRVRLQQLLGAAFVALTFDDVRNGPELMTMPQSPALRHYLITHYDAPHDSGLRDRSFYDPGGSLTQRFGADPGTTYLVRPDGHVARVEPPGGRRVEQLYEEYVGRSHLQDDVSGKAAVFYASQS